MRLCNYILSPTRINNAKPNGKLYKLTDDGGLFIEVSAAGLKTWRYVWESRCGTILIDVAGEDVFVNGQRVERHAHPAMHSAKPSASLGQSSRRENPFSMIRYGKMPYP